MGGDSIENSSGEIESNEVDNGIETETSEVPEVTVSEIEAAFDEESSQTDVDKTNVELADSHSEKSEYSSEIVSDEEINKAFDEKNSENGNCVSAKESKNEYYDINKTENDNSLKNEIASDAEKIENKYDRPTSFRAGVRDQVWENAKDDHGRVRDPVSGKYMSKDQPWHMGHKPGYEFSKHQESAERRQISREEFLDEHNNPGHYRPELPGSNMSHKGESKTENYYE